MSDFRAAIVDVDGTVVLGDDPISGAPEGVQRLRDAGLDIVFLSNNPTKRREQYVDRLTPHGIHVDPGQTLTAASVTGEYLAEEHVSDDLFVIGSSGLLNGLRRRGLNVDTTPSNADVLLVSMDRSFDYETMTEAMWALDEETTFLGTDPDMTIPTPERPEPGTGAILHAVAGVTGREPERILGKPSRTAADAALDRLGVPPEDVLVIGDRLDTDIELGRRAGMTTAVVLSGITDRSDIDDAEQTPDHVLDSLGDIDTLL